MQQLLEALQEQNFARFAFEPNAVHHVSEWGKRSQAQNTDYADDETSIAVYRL